MGWMGRKKKERHVKKARRGKGRQEKKESGRIGKASRGGTGWEMKGGKGNRSSNYETIVEFGLCRRVQARSGALSYFNLSGQSSMYTLCGTMETASIQEHLAMHGNHAMLK
jgi:hypothetical protein